MRIRTLKSKSGSTVVQIGIYEGKNFKINKHIGSAKNDNDLKLLLIRADQILKESQNSLPFQQAEESVSDYIQISKLKPLGYNHIYAYTVLNEYFTKIFDISSNYLKDLAIMRLIKPTSKLESIENLKEYFGITYSKSDLHRKIQDLLKLEGQVFESAIKYAKDYLDFKFQFVFYDVTTLYFETHLNYEQKEMIGKAGENIELRQYGFSKDKRNDLPQILIGLVVDQNGFPIYYQIFEGNKFEGHTIVPVIQDFKDKFKIQELTIIADSGMLSQNNLIELEQAKLFYIVGGRINQESTSTLESIQQELNSLDNHIVTRTQANRKTVYQFSKKRYQKDKYECEKQLKKAESVIQNPQLAKKRLKFVTTTDQTIHLNQTMLNKAKLSLGIKSYVTNNLNLNEDTIIQTYCNLWHVEKAFRMSKTDLEIRPVFHRKKETIQIHILIVFTSLVMAKVIELEEQKSIKRYIKDIMKILEFRLQDRVSGKIYSFESEPSTLSM